MKRNVFIVAGCTLAAGLLAYVYWDDERRLSADIEVMSKSGRVGTYMGSFDYACFSPSSLIRPEEISEALKLSGVDLSKSLNAACGLWCCNLSSDHSAVSLIKNGEVRCLEIHRLLFIPGDDDRMVCARPSELQVTQETYEAPQGLSRPPWISRGTQFYRIRRGKK